MLVRLGQRDSTEDVVDLLRACHGRIRDFLSAATRLAAGAGAPPGEISAAAGRIRRYFADAFPLHVADEDEDIAPRLQPSGGEVAAALAAMHADHAAHARPVARLVELCGAIERAPGQLGAASDELARTAQALSLELEAHLALEERVVFPALQRLPEPERDAIRAAIRARRERAPG